MDTIRLLRLFVSIADTGSLSAVARGWGVAPSTVTQGLKQLEEHLGTQLMVRTTRKLSLTAEGEHFLQQSRQILSDLNDVMEGFSDKGSLSGNIRLTVMNDLGRERIAPLIDDFMELHPDLNIQLFLSDRMVDLVEDGFDFGIRTGPLPNSEMKARLLTRGRKCVCASPEYWKRAGKPQHPRELADHNCLVLGTPGDLKWFWTFRENGKPLRVRVSGNRQVNDGYILRRWAITGAGVAMKSYFDIEEDVKAGRLETALDDFTPDQTNLYAVSPARGHVSRRVSALIDFLHMALAESR